MNTLAFNRIRTQKRIRIYPPDQQLARPGPGINACVGAFDVLPGQGRGAGRKTDTEQHQRRRHGAF